MRIHQPAFCVVILVLKNFFVRVTAIIPKSASKFQAISLYLFLNSFAFMLLENFFPMLTCFFEADFGLELQNALC